MNIFHHSAPRPPVVPGEEEPCGIEGECRGETEGRSRSPCGSPPNCLRWALSLPVLLSDPIGVRLFSRYLQAEGQAHADALDFWFACKGLRKTTDPDRVQQIIKVIYRRFFVKSQLGVNDTLRKSIHSKVKRAAEGTLGVTVFDAAQAEVEKIINDTAYPNFLKSDIYLAHIRSMQEPGYHPGPLVSDVCSSGSASGGGSGGNTVSKQTLATLHEDHELDTSTLSQVPPPHLTLTKDSLLMTQQARAADLRPTTEAYADLLHGKTSTAPKMYSSYNPVSRQDSELQSLSSDARTESDSISLTDSSIDGMSMGGGQARMTRRQYQAHCRKVKEAAFMNREPYTHHTVIPRTQRIHNEQVHPMKPDEFARILTEKLEIVKKEQEAQEKLDHKLSEGQITGKSLVDAIRERLFQMDDDDGQHILDQHVSRVWSDLTPGARSPGSPTRPRSPELHRPVRSKQSCGLQPLSKVITNGGSSGINPHMSSYQYQQTRGHARHPRKEKDAFSTFSSDSGNVHDFSEGYERLHIPKSKSMPDYSESSDAYSSLPGRSRGEWNRRHSSKRPELTDSGVSVVSESISHHSAQFKERVLCWLMENDHRTPGGGPHSDCASPCSSGPRFHRSTLQPSDPTPKGRRSPANEQTSLEEARKRLEEQTKVKSRQRSSGNNWKGGSTSCETAWRSGSECGAQSGGSTLRPRSEPGFTTVVFSFCDEQFPYRSKIPGTSITLRQFKEHLPKKGNYRFFFKTECEEEDMKVIQEEMTDDNDILPLWEGKVMAQVTPAD